MVFRKVTGIDFYNVRKHFHKNTMFILKACFSSFDSPYFGEEFAGEIPKKFRTLSVLLYDVVSKSEKVLRVCFIKT